MIETVGCNGCTFPETLYKALHDIARLEEGIKISLQLEINARTAAYETIQRLTRQVEELQLDILDLHVRMEAKND